MFTNVTSVTNLGEHSIQLISSDPVRSKAYPVSYAMREIIDHEIDAKLKARIIEPSNASYASALNGKPMIRVKSLLIEYVLTSEV